MGWVALCGLGAVVQLGVGRTAPNPLVTRGSALCIAAGVQCTTSHTVPLHSSAPPPRCSQPPPCAALDGVRLACGVTLLLQALLVLVTVHLLHALALHGVAVHRLDGQKGGEGKGGRGVGRKEGETTKARRPPRRWTAGKRRTDEGQGNGSSDDDGIGGRIESAGDSGL